MKSNAARFISLIKLLAFTLLLFQSLLLMNRADAYVHSVSTSLIHDILSESLPTIFAPLDFSTDDFELVWNGETPQGVRLNLVPGTVQWVRVADIHVFPRARLRIEADGIDGGLMQLADFSHYLHPPAQQLKDATLLNTLPGFIVPALKPDEPKMTSDGPWSLETPVALISGPKNTIKITLMRSGKKLSYEAVVRFKANGKSGEQLAYFDSSCSPFQVTTEWVTPPTGKSWMAFACRRVITKKDQNYKAGTFEIFAYWDNVGETIKIANVDTPSAQPSMWLLRPASSPSQLELSASNGELVRLKYRYLEVFSSATLGVGVGPYLYTFSGVPDGVQTTVPLVTLYGSYFITERVRLVMFDATAIHKKFFTDFGVYVPSESFRILDNRISLNLMLGGHVIAFNAEDETLARLGFPQGLELIFRDFLFRSYSMSVGAFVFPPIKDQLYYNAWWRYGKGSVFFEVNYIAWRERAIRQLVYTRSLGVSVGFPLANFL